MEEDLITFETAKLAKEKGFNEICYYNYDLCLQDIIEEGKIKYKKDSTCLLNYTNLNSEFKDGQYWANFSVTTQSLLQKWLRENYSIDIHFGRTGVRDVWNLDGISKFGYPFIESKHRFKTEFKSYEDALEFGLIEALKLI